MSETRWTRLARADLADVDDYYASQNPDFADRVGRQAIAAGRFLAGTPFAGLEIAPDHRRWRVPGTPYLLIYRVAKSGVEIVRVWHERRDLPPLVD